MMLIYNMWLARNDAQEKDRIVDPLEIVKRSTDGVEEWMHLNDQAPTARTKVLEHRLAKN
jgi:hypothetical protein